MQTVLGSVSDWSGRRDVVLCWVNRHRQFSWKGTERATPQRDHVLDKDRAPASLVCSVDFGKGVWT